VQDSSSCAGSPEKPEQQGWQQERGASGKDHHERVLSTGAGTFRAIMSQREMEILTTWFPKHAETLAAVLRNHSHGNETQSGDRSWVNRER
jgi:hypothetical protein